MLSVFCSPSRYTQGQDATARLGEEMATLGLEGPALVVAGRSPARMLSQVWKASFGDAGFTHEVHPFGGECTLAEIARIKDRATACKAGVIVGSGGGKSLTRHARRRPISGFRWSAVPPWLPATRLAALSR